MHVPQTLLPVVCEWLSLPGGISLPPAIRPLLNLMSAEIFVCQDLLSSCAGLLTVKCHVKCSHDKLTTCNMSVNLLSHLSRIGSWRRCKSKGTGSAAWSRGQFEPDPKRLHQFIFASALLSELGFNTDLMDDHKRHGCLFLLVCHGFLSTPALRVHPDSM